MRLFILFVKNKIKDKYIMSVKEELIKMFKDRKMTPMLTLSKEVRDVVLVSVGVLGGIALVRIAEAYSNEDEQPPSDEMKQQMNNANKMAKTAKKLAAKAIKNADKAMSAMRTSGK